MLKLWKSVSVSEDCWGLQRWLVYPWTVSTPGICCLFQGHFTTSWHIPGRGALQLAKMTVGLAGSITECPKLMNRLSRCCFLLSFAEKRLFWIQIYVAASANLSSFWLFGLWDGRVPVWSVSQQAINLSLVPHDFPPRKYTNPCTNEPCSLIGCSHTLRVTPGLTPSSHEYSALRRGVFIHGAAGISHFIFRDNSKQCGDHLPL